MRFVKMEFFNFDFHTETIISLELVKFAECLAPTKEFNKIGKALVQQVFDYLKLCLPDVVNRHVTNTYIGGSFGKNTAVIFPDFDCVIFLEHAEPPFDLEIDEIKGILETEAMRLNVDEESIKSSKTTVMFKFRNGVEVDLLPACAYSKDDANEQYLHVLARLEDPFPNNERQYSSSLAEIQIDFIRSQSKATHQLIQIAKYWYKSGYFWCYGGSLIMEILCVCTVLDLGDSFSMLHGFYHFLTNYILKLDTLKIAFLRGNGNGSWTRIPEDDCILFYDYHFGPEILQRETFIIEPANPHNDLAPNLKANLQEMKRYGKEMLARLEELEYSDISYAKLFQPFKLVLSKFYPEALLPTQVYVDYDHRCSKFKYGTDKVTVHNRDFFKTNPKAKWVYETALTSLLFLIRAKSCPSGDQPLTFEDGCPVLDGIYDVIEGVEVFLKANFTKDQVLQSSDDYLHESTFVTLKIPYIGFMREKVAVRVSMIWSSRESRKKEGRGTSNGDRSKKRSDTECVAM